VKPRKKAKEQQELNEETIEKSYVEHSGTDENCTTSVAAIRTGIG
jgi:hypothetical protein